ncbi:MAG: hypothetical protein IJ306_04420 [Oscillospiraceae bacterium]|nr:hypothetical protein [Oscillospiraceae bacterium]
MKKLAAMLMAIFLLCSCGAGKEIPATDGEAIEGYHEENEFEEKWGLALSVKDVTPKGLTVVFNQSGGAPTGSLDTGSYYSLERWENGEWAEVKKEPGDAEFMWTLTAWLIFMEGTTEMETNWELLYGELPAGIYRIGKEVSDFRGTGDYDKAMFYAEFVLE